MVPTQINNLGFINPGLILKDATSVHLDMLVACPQCLLIPSEGLSEGGFSFSRWVPNIQPVSTSTVKPWDAPKRDLFTISALGEGAYVEMFFSASCLAFSTYEIIVENRLKSWC